MNDLSTKLQERLALNANWTFLKLVSNTIIVDDAIHAHQENNNKKKALTAPSGSAPPKYRMVCPPHCHPPHQHRHQLVICPPPHQDVLPSVVAPPLIVSRPPSQKMGIVSNTCYNCGQVSHIVRDYIAPRRNSAPRS
jgi:hypothetical protein